VHKHAPLVFDAHAGDANDAMSACQRRRVGIAAAAICMSVACGRSDQPPPLPADPTAEVFQQLAARVDPYSDKARVIVLTDIANEPDDQMSMVRLACQRVRRRGPGRTTSTWMREGPPT
jgi:hypothetical protein